MPCLVLTMCSSDLRPVLSTLLFLTHMCACAQEAVPIELNARIGGAETYTNVLTAWGVDLARAALRISCGLLPQPPLHLIGAHHQAACAGREAAAERGADSPLPLPTDLILPAHPWYSQSSIETHSDGGQPSVSSVSPDPSGDDGECVCGSGLAGGCGCPTTCCSAGRCCYWDFVSDRASPGAAGLRAPSLRCLSEPTPELNPGAPDPGGCLCAAKARSKLDPSHQQQEQPSHIADSIADEHHQPAAPRCQAYTDAACSRRPSSSGRGSPGGSAGGREGEGVCCFAADDSPELREKGRYQNGRPSSRPSCLSDTEHQSAQPAQLPSGATASPSCLKEALPLCHVHSVNFLPDWEGWGVIQRQDLGGGARAHPGYVDAELYGRPGDRVALPPAGFSAMGWMVAQSIEGPEGAERAMQQMMDHVVIELGPADPLG